MAMGDHDGEMAGAVPGVRGRVPTRRFGYVSVVHDNKLVLFGGFDGSRWLNDMYVFDFQTRGWSVVQAKGMLPSVRSCPAWAKDDTHVYIQGGYDGVERKDDFFACDLSTYTWTQMPSMGSTPSPRYFHSCCLCTLTCSNQTIQLMQDTNDILLCIYYRRQQNVSLWRVLWKPETGRYACV
jgi:hypothetical protein